MSANHPASLARGKVFLKTPGQVHFIFAAVCVVPAEGAELLADGLVHNVLGVESFAAGRVVAPTHAERGYLQMASRASRVRLMSRICAARVWMGCMDRSSSSQRAISVYMPFMLMSTDSPRLSTESLYVWM